MPDTYQDRLAAVEAALHDVERALARLDDGSYWTCEACGEPITEDRLAGSPTVRTCERHTPAPDAG